MKRTCSQNIVYSISLSPVALMISALGGQIGTLVFGAADYQEIRFASLNSLPPAGSFEEFLDVTLLAPLVETICLAIFIKVFSSTSLVNFIPPIAGLVFGVLHWVSAPQSFFGAFGIFWLFSIVFIRARETGFRCGFFSATLIHGLTNFYLFLISRPCKTP